MEVLLEVLMERSWMLLVHLILVLELEDELASGVKNIPDTLTPNHTPRVSLLFVQNIIGLTTTNQSNSVTWRYHANKLNAGRGVPLAFDVMARVSDRLACGVMPKNCLTSFGLVRWGRFLALWRLLKSVEVCLRYVKIYFENLVYTTDEKHLLMTFATTFSKDC